MLKERSKKEFDGIKKIEKQNEGKEITDERIYSNIGPGWGGGPRKPPGILLYQEVLNLFEETFNQIEMNRNIGIRWVSYYNE